MNVYKDCNLRNPFSAGSTKYKSLLFTIPSRIVKQHKIDPTTLFHVSCDSSGIHLEYVQVNKKSIPADQTSFAANGQQVSVIGGK